MSVGPGTEFPRLIPVVDTSAGALFWIPERRVTLVWHGTLRLCCFASDSASVMVSQHNSVWIHIKEVLRDCILMKCICHSLALCIQRAFVEFSPNLGYLLKEIPAQFAQNTLRRETFKSPFDVMNADSEQHLCRHHFKCYQPPDGLCESK